MWFPNYNIFKKVKPAYSDHIYTGRIPKTFQVSTVTLAWQ